MKRRKAMALLTSTALTAVSCKTLAQTPGRFSRNTIDDYVAVAIERDFATSQDLSLQQRAKAKGLFYGSAIKGRTFDDTAFITQFVQECGAVVPEGALKWKALRPTADSFDFSQGDLVVEFVQKHSLLLRGHTLVWDKHVPDWLMESLTSENAESLLTQHITTVASHYRNRIHSWDVVNEAVSNHSDRPDHFKPSPWLNFLGPTYVETAFHLAKTADPNALMVYNDNGLDHAGYRFDRKREAVLTLLETLKAKKTPIDALGMQAHLCARSIEFDFNKLRDFLAHVASLGLQIMITELDVTDTQFPSGVENRDQAVAAVYEDYLTCVLDEPAVKGVMTWGLSDRYTWLSKKRPREDGLPVRPLPLDSQLNRKPAWNAIARAFDQAPPRNV